jgi:hypothetical protein
MREASAARGGPAPPASILLVIQRDPPQGVEKD